MTALREVRNACAHGNLLFGMTLSSGIRTGEACASFNGNDNQTFKGALRVIDYLLRQVSVNRANDMWREIYKATYLLYQKTPSMRPIVENQTGIIVPEKSAFRRGIEAIASKIVKFRRKKHR